MSAALTAMNGTRAAKVAGYAKSGFDVRDIWTALEQQSTIVRKAVRW
jgi:hypothetical protein